MGFFEDLGKKVADAGQKTVQKTKEMSDVTRLELLAKKEEGKLNQLYGQVGRLYVELHGDDFEEAFAELIGQVKDAGQTIQSYRQQIEEIKTSGDKKEEEVVSGRRCPECGVPVPEGRRFCTSCGKPIPQEEEPAEEPAEEESAGKVCSNCGAVLADDALFCEKCGTKV